jgi:hypothetical protein
MTDPTDLLTMEVSEPWNFSSGPVRLQTKERSSDERWTVAILSGWSGVRKAVLAARYQGQTLLPLRDGRPVVVNLTAGGDMLIGTVRTDLGA